MTRRWLGGVALGLLIGCGATPGPPTTPPPTGDPPGHEPAAGTEADGLRDDALTARLVATWKGQATVTWEGSTYDDDVTFALDEDGDTRVIAIFMMGSIGQLQDVPAGTWRVEDDRLVLVFSGHTRIAEPDEDYDPPDVGVCIHVAALADDVLTGTWGPWTEADGCATSGGESIELARVEVH